ncbi:MAG: SGNH/GDSL hydrolase family protein [Pseudomonadota bacterium]
MKGAVAGWLVIVAIFALCLEVFSFAILAVVPQFQSLTFRTPDVTPAQYEAYLAERDPELGWPSKAWLAANTDERGARTSPANAALGDARPCVSVYGDSFAFGDEVEDDGTWANYLAENLGCRVESYGVGGYGTDQALLRFERHVDEGRDLGEVTILTLYPDNLNRNVNQWRYLLSGEPLSFKPAFYVTESDEVVLAPLFDGEYDAAMAAMDAPATALPAELYAPGAPGLRRSVRASFPYTLALTRIAVTLGQSIRSFETDGNPNHINYPVYFDSAEGPSEAKRRVAVHIIERFARLCEEGGRRCALVLLPDPELVYLRDRVGNHGLNTWLGPAASGLTYLDATDVFGDLSDICAHLTNAADCKGHYSPAGNARVAEFLREELSLGLLRD